MVSYRIASTALSELRPLGTPGQRAHGLVTQTVERECGGAHAALFAEPMPDPKSGRIDWFVEAEAPPRRLLDLDESEAALARRRLGELAADISRLGTSLSQSRDVEAQRLGKALLNALEIPGEECIYLAGDQPVLMCWGYHHDTPQAARGVLSALMPLPPPAAPAAVAAAAAAPEGPRPAAGSVLTAVAAPASYSWLWWLLWLLILLLTLAILYTVLTACGLRALPFANFCPQAQAATAVLDAEAARRGLLEDRIADLQRDLVREGAACRQTAAAPEPPSDLPSAPEEPQEPQQTEAAPPPQEEQTAELEDCPAKRPVEVVLLLDASTSMRWDFDVDPAVDRQVDEINRRIEQTSSLPHRMVLIAQREVLYRRLDNSPGTDRIVVAKEALTRIVQQSPADVTFNFLSFNACGAPRNHGSYAPSERSALVGRIQGLQLGDHTALSDALRHAPSYVSGGRSAEEPANIVLVSDGSDSCHGDPCAAAQWLAGELPYTHVNFIAMGRGLDAMRCVPEATQGLFLEAHNVEELFRVMSTASGQDLPEHCK